MYEGSRNLYCGNILLLQNPDMMSALQWSYLLYSCLLTELRPLAFTSPERSFDWILSNFSRYLLTSFVSFRISSWYSFFWLFQERYTASSRVSPIISFVEVAYDCLLLLTSGLVMITVVSLFVIFHVVNCSFEYVPTIIFYQQTNCSIFSLESLLMQVSMLMRTSSFLIQNSLRAHIFPCSIIMPVPHMIILVPIWLYFSVRHFLCKIFYVGVYCSLGTDHSNSSMGTIYSTQMSTVPLVWYWPFKFEPVYLFPWYHTDDLVQSCFILMHHYDVTTEVKARQHHNKNQLTLSYYSQHGHVTVKEPYSVTSYQEGCILCYQCGRDDFGLNQKSLSAHVCHCSFNPYTTSQIKRKSDHPVLTTLLVALHIHYWLRRLTLSKTTPSNCQYT